MSEQGRSGINRAFSWLKKTLQITEKTVAPDALSPLVVPTMDVFGWERREELEGINFAGAAAADNVPTAVAPEGFMRYVASCSIQSTDNLQALFLWIEQRTTRGGGIDTAIQTPFLQPIGGDGIRVALMRPVLLRPGDRLVGRSNPAPGAGTALSIRMTFVDLPIGEYVPAI